MHNLSEKQKNFCREYVKDFNGLQSAIRAGYSKKTANEQASRLLTNVNIQKYVSELTAKVAEKAQITAVEVVRRIISLADRSEAEEDRQSEARALKMLGDATGTFTTNLKVDGLIPVKAEVEFIGDDSKD